MFQHENNTQEVKEVRLPNFGQNFCGTVVSIQSGSKDQCLGLQECSEPLEPPLGSEQTQEPHQAPNNRRPQHADFTLHSLTDCGSIRLSLLHKHSVHS
jgi:hypothetical protein